MYIAVQYGHHQDQENQGCHVPVSGNPRCSSRENVRSIKLRVYSHCLPRQYPKGDYLLAILERLPHIACVVRLDAMPVGKWRMWGHGQRFLEDVLWTRTHMVEMSRSTMTSQKKDLENNGVRSNRRIRSRPHERKYSTGVRHPWELWSPLLVPCSPRPDFWAKRRPTLRVCFLIPMPEPSRSVPIYGAWGHRTLDKSFLDGVRGMEDRFFATICKTTPE